MNANHLIPIVFFSLAGLSVLLWLLFEHKRNKALRALADRLQMDYTKKPDPHVLSEHTFFDLFNHGRSRRATHLLHRSINDLSTSYFEYSYVTGHGKHSSTHRQSIASISNSAITFPHFVLTPENFLHRIVQKFKGEDINFESHPKFSKMFQLKGHNEVEIRKLFSDDVIRFFENCEGLNVETHENRVIFYRKQRRCSVKQIEEFIRDSLKTYETLI